MFIYLGNFLMCANFQSECHCQLNGPSLTLSFSPVTANTYCITHSTLNTQCIAAKTSLSSLSPFNNSLVVQVPCSHFQCRAQFYKMYIFTSGNIKILYSFLKQWRSGCSYRYTLSMPRSQQVAPNH